MSFDLSRAALIAHMEELRDNCRRGFVGWARCQAIIDVLEKPDEHLEEKADAQAEEAALGNSRSEGVASQLPL